MLLNAKDTVFRMDGVVVGGVVTYQFFQGEPQEAIHRPLSGSPISLPGGEPDYGTCQLRLGYDETDAGQAKLFDSYRNHTVYDCDVTWSNGNTQSFKAYTQTMSIAGTKATAGDTSLASPVLLRICGLVS